MELMGLLYENGYLPEWDEEVFEKVMEQAENFKKFSGDSTRNKVDNTIYQFQSEDNLSMVAQKEALYGNDNLHD